jgi:hypothetical protein
LNLVLLLILFTSKLLFCQNYDLEQGVYFDRPVYGDTNRHKYTIDNISYKLNSTYTYTYFFKDSSGKKKRFYHQHDFSHNNNPLNLCDFNDSSANYLDRIQLVVDDPRQQFIGNDSNYSQTVISYNYLNKYGKWSDTIWGDYKSQHPNLSYSDEHTGVVDNPINLWLHPPRRFTFKILQLNPFPLYFLDKSQKEWDSQLNTGGGWLDSRWIICSKQSGVPIHFHYKRLPTHKLKTALGELECQVTDGVGTLLVDGHTYHTFLKSFYHENYGFLKLEYVNIDGSIIELQLISLTHAK